MRSDNEELKHIGIEIVKPIEVGCLTTDTKLLPEITEFDVAKNPEYCKRTSANLPPDDQGGLSKESFENNVTILITTIKDLSKTLALMTQVEWIKQVLIAVFADEEESLRVYSDTLEAAKNKSHEVVVIRKRSEIFVSSTSTKDSSTSKYSSLKRSPSHKSVAFPARPSTQSRSPTRRAMSPMQSSPPDSPKKCLTSPTSSPSSSPSASPVKTRASSAKATEIVSKKSKLDLDEVASSTIYRRHESHESMETDETERQQSIQNTLGLSNISKVPSPQNSQWDKFHQGKDSLKALVSFLLEVQVVRVLERILSLLQSVKARRDPNAQVAAVTTLDKLIFEVEGLLSQSITESGKKMKEEIEKQRLSPKLSEELLRVNGVYGCGTFYDRLNIHIEVNEGDSKERIQEEIKNVATKYNYKDTDYTVSVVKSRPTMYGSLVVCSV